MPATDTLEIRIEAEFAAFDERIRRDREEQIRAFHERQQRLAALEPRLEQLIAFAKPRIEALAKHFGDRVQITPKLETTRGEASVRVRSDLADIRIRLSVSPDTDVRNLVF